MGTGKLCRDMSSNPLSVDQDVTILARVGLVTRWIQTSQQGRGSLRRASQIHVQREVYGNFHKQDRGVSHLDDIDDTTFPCAFLPKQRDVVQ